MDPEIGKLETSQPRDTSQLGIAVSDERRSCLALTDPSCEVDADLLGAERALGVGLAPLLLLLATPVQANLQAAARREATAFGVRLAVLHRALAQRHGDSPRTRPSWKETEK